MFNTTATHPATDEPSSYVVVAAAPPPLAVSGRLLSLSSRLTQASRCDVTPLPNMCKAARVGPSVAAAGDVMKPARRALHRSGESAVDGKSCQQALLITR